MHVIPFIFKIILEISDTIPITYIRMPREKFYLSLQDFGNYFSINLIKHLVLNLITKQQIRAVRSRKILSNDYFIGVLATGNMTVSSIKNALNVIRYRKDVLIEILFHPGGVSSADTVTWTKKDTFRRYYSSVRRIKEARLLTDPSIGEVVKGA